jgi:hypothetical protein
MSLRELRLGKPVPRTPSEANEGCQAEARRAKADWIRGNALPRVRRFRLMGCFVHCHHNAETRVRSCQRVCTQDRSILAEWRRRRETYALFAELFSQPTRAGGCAGIIVRTGIATDSSTSVFFRDLSPIESSSASMIFKPVSVILTTSVTRDSNFVF